MENADKKSEECEKSDEKIECDDKGLKKYMIC